MDFESLINQQRSDQAIAGMKDLASSIAAFHESLKEQGIDDFEALEITKEFISVLFHHMREQGR